MIGPSSTKGAANVADARRLFRARSMDRAEAEALFPDADPSDLDAAWAGMGDGAEPHREIQPSDSRIDRPGEDGGGSQRVTDAEAVAILTAARS